LAPFFFRLMAGADCSVVIAPLLTPPPGPPPGAPGGAVSRLEQSVSGTLAPGEVAYFFIDVPFTAGTPAFGGTSAPPPALRLELTLPRSAGGADGADGGSAAPLLLLLNATAPASLASEYVSDDEGVCDATRGCYWAVSELPPADATPRVAMAGRHVHTAFLLFCCLCPCPNPKSASRFARARAPFS
jgi:hypothetical protein